MSASSSAGATQNDTPAKERRTRRRLRLSCVECTRRRQKCDRNQPCGLCVSRGVSHLCRWENVPVARPPPRRPPGFAVEPKPHSSREEELLSRIATLEDVISQLQSNSSVNSFTRGDFGSEVSQSQTAGDPASLAVPDLFRSSSYSSTSSSSSSPDLHEHQRPLEDGNRGAENDNFEAYTITAALSQVSLVHYGEYLGRGTIFASLHTLSSPQGSSVQYAKSADAIYGFNQLGLDVGLPLFPSTVDDLISCLPSSSVTILLSQAFFTELNWGYGIPEDWFYSACGQMWDFLRGPQGGAANINPHWLSLLFAILASAPRAHAQVAQSRDPGVSSSSTYFQYAMAAKRIAEIAYMTTPQFPAIESAADGAVLGCLATPLLAGLLFQRTLASEAWKLVGNSIRDGQAVGLHQSPDSKRWCMMSETEKILRTRAWWNLIIFDTMLSFKLSRPSMSRPGTHDVMPPSSDLGFSRSWSVFHYHFIQFVEVVQLAMDKCMKIAQDPSGAQVFDVDRAFVEWQSQLPSEFRGANHTSTAVLRRQGEALRTWYFSCRLKLHRTYLAHHGQIRSPTAVSQHPWLSKSRELCLDLATEIIELQCGAPPAGSPAFDGLGEEAYFPNSSLEGVHSLFDAAVTMIMASALLEPQHRTVAAENLVGQAMLLLSRLAQMAEDGRRDVATRSLEALKVLERGDYWRRPGSSADQSFTLA
ncbi:hypothetical protein HGRIS_002407 [Hohenbuehelia grisea]|uniref:Zn(2)-C6 fungal-type domain-containing protein n=1 Tax=Hohenbuehelia grisea TaxID=104357 RepID=A0ABR3JKF5_9AGAR